MSHEPSRAERVSNDLAKILYGIREIHMDCVIDPESNMYCKPRNEGTSKTLKRDAKKAHPDPGE